jgi:predicted aspartyl protease
MNGAVAKRLIALALLATVDCDVSLVLAQGQKPNYQDGWHKVHFPSLIEYKVFHDRVVALSNLSYRERCGSHETLEGKIAQINFDDHGDAGARRNRTGCGGRTSTVLINGQITLNFTIDSGAADVSIPADVLSTLIRTGTIKKSDFIGQKTYRLADGSTVPSATFVIRSLKVGNHLLENVTGSVASAEAELLLGQSFLRRFNSWSIDNKRQVLLLN